MENRPDFCSSIEDFMGIIGKECCLTGDFNYGSKSDVSEFVIKHGGTVADKVRKTTSVLIVGAKGSAAWAYGNYGTKVVKALDARKNGHFIFIILEEDFFKAMENMPEGSAEAKADDPANPNSPLNEYMSDKERIKIAKNTFELLVNGINPVTNEPIDSDECIFEPKISDCLLYVTEILQQLSDDEWVKKTSKRILFTVTEEQLKGFQYSDTPITISEIARRLSTLRTDPHMYPMSMDRFRKWLLANNYLQRKELGNGKGINVPTAAGYDIGMGLETRVRTMGQFEVTTYSLQAQHFLINNLAEILAFSSRPNEFK